MFLLTGFGQSGFLRQQAMTPDVVFPTAVADPTNSQDFDSHVDIDVAANDIDGTNPRDLSSVAIVHQPLHGLATVLGGGLVRYTSTTGFSGVDTFSYTIADTVGLVSNEALVTVAVKEAPIDPAAPSILGHSATCVFNNHVDTDVLIDATAGANAIAPATLTVVTAPTRGSTSLLGAGVIRYTSTTGLSGADSYTCRVADTAGIVSNTALVSVNVDPGVAPSAVPDSPSACDFNSHIDISVLANDTGGTDVISASTLAIVTAPTRGALTLLGAGVVRYTATVGLSGDDSFTYRVSDIVGRVSNTALVSVTVSPDIPPVVTPPTAIADPTNPCTYHGHVDTTVTANDTPGTNAIDTSTVVVVNQPAQGTAVFQGAGVVRYTSTGIGGLSDSYTYTVADSSSHRSAAALVTVQVAAKPAAPVAVADTPPACDFHGHIDTTVTANDTATSPATIDTSTVVIVAAPTHGTATVQGSGVVRYTSTGNSGSDSYTYTVADSFGTRSNAALVSVTVTADASLFANGYAKRARARVPRALLPTALTNPIWTYDRTVANLKTSGGDVTSSTGLDIRFTDGNGVQLKHRNVKYDSSTGRLRAHLLIPSVTANADYNIFVYAGNSGANEPDAVGLYAQTISTHNCQTGADLSGGGRNMTMTGVTAGTAFEEAGQYATGNTPDTIVSVATTIGLTRTAANIIVPTINATAQNFITVGANQTSDLRDKVVSNHQKPPGKFSPYRPRGCGDQAVLTGFKAVGLQPDTLVWRQMKSNLSPYTTGDYDDNGCLSETQAGTLIYENFSLDNQMDGINTPTDNTNRPVTVRGGYARRIRDDFIENDSMQTLLVEDVLVDSCHMFISQRPGSLPASTAHVTTIRNCLIRLRGQAYDTDVGGDAQAAGSKLTLPYPDGSVVSPTGTALGYSHGWFFKTATNCMNIAISNCVLMLESIPTGGDSLAVWPPGTYSNVQVIWLGPGSFASNFANAVPSGVTVTTDIALWNTKRALWLDVHGCPDSTGDDFWFLHTAGVNPNPATVVANGKYLAAGLSAYYGRSALTVEFWAKPDAADIGTDHGLVCLGPSDDDAFSNHTFVLSMDLLGFYANVDGTVSDNVYTSTVLLSTAGGLDCARIEGASGEQSTAAQHLALLFRSGQLMEQRKNGVPTSPTFVGEGDSSHPPHDHLAGKVLTGTTAAPTRGGLRLGAGPVGPAAGNYRGQLAELRSYPAYRSVAVMASEVQSYSDPDSFMGHSTFAAFGANQGPVAAPMAVTCPASGSADIDVLGASFEPDGDAMTLRSRTSGASGSSRIVLPFTSGGSYQILTGDTITGAASGVTATINGPVTLTSGSWAGGNAAGTLTYSTQSGIWQSETLNVGAHTDVATINPTQAFIRYSNTDATATSDTCTYTITDPSGLTSTGKISVTIDQDGEIPQAMNTFNVNGDAQLDAYLAGTGGYGARAPGDMAIMTGNFKTNRTFSLIGTSARPYIFKAATKQGSNVMGPWTIQGAYQFFWGFTLRRDISLALPANDKIAADGSKMAQVGIGGSHNTIRRWEFTDWDAPWAIAILGGDNGIVDYCEWHHPRPWVGTPVALANGNPDYNNSTFEFASKLLYTGKFNNFGSSRMGVRTAEGIDAGGPIPSSWHFDFKMRRCYGHDFFDKPWPHDYGSGQNDFMEIGQSGGDIATGTLIATSTGTGVDKRAKSDPTGWWHSRHTYEYILLQNHMEGQATGAASIDFKAPAITVKKVTMIDCPGRMDMRWGPFHVWEDIVITRSQGSWIEGYGNTISRYKMSGNVDRLNASDQHVNGTPKLSLIRGQDAADWSCRLDANQSASQACTVTQVQGGIGVGDNSIAAGAKAYDHIFTNCTIGSSATADNANRHGCHADGIPADQQPTECLITDVGLMADYVPGEYD